MRGGRSLAVLMVVALGLGAYIYFVESERDPLQTEQKEKVFTVETEAVETLEIRNAAGESTSLKKTGDSWSITAPVSAEADASAVSSIVGALSTLEIDRQLEEASGSLAPFGLEPPRATVTFTASGDTTPRRLLLGNKTPTGTHVYAKVDGQPKLFLLMAHLDDTLNRTTMDLRDKRILSIARDAVDSVEIAARGKTPVRAARKDAMWRVTAPIDARADTAPVDGLISRVEQARMTTIVSEGSEPTAAQLRTYGLDTPALTVAFGTGSSKATLALGATKDEDELYARDLSRQIVFTVEPALLTDLEKSPADLRVKDVFGFNAFSARGLDITHAGTTTTFGRTKPAGTTDASAPELWSVTAPAAREVNQTAMTDLLNTLSGLRVERFVEAAPAAGDDMAVAVRYGESSAPTEERVTLRKSGGSAYVIKSGETGAGIIPAAEFDRAVTQLQAVTSPK